MADRTDISGTAISTAYLQLLFTSDTAGVTVTGAGTPDSIVCSSNAGTAKKSCLRIGVDQCSIATGSHNFDVASHNGTYGLKLGGTLVTALGAELNYNDVAAIGTTAASKSMVTDSNGAIQFPDSNATTHRLDFGASSDMVMYHDGSNSYIRNKTGILKIATEASGIAVTIGHTTSETTVADNLNTTGLIRVNDTTEATSATDGSLQTDGGLSVVKSAVIGDDLDLLSDSAILNMGAGKDFTITHDGTTGATLAGTPISINSTGDLTLDSSTDIILDADGADIIFKDAGTAIGKISNSSSDLVIENEVDAKDIIFKQYDGSEVCRMADDRRLYFYDKGGEYIYGDGTDLNIVASADINIPVNVGLRFGDGGENIETDNTNLTITSGVDIILAATAVNITADVIDLSDATKDVTLNSAVDAINFDSNTLSIDASNNRVGIGTAAPGSSLEVKDGKFSLTDADVVHGITNVAPTNAYGDFGPIHSTYGGLYINGISDQENAGARSLALRGICNDTHTDTVPTVELIGAKRSGTTIQALAAAETVLQVANHTSTLMTVLGSGSVGVGTVTPDTTLEVVGSFAANGPSSTFVTFADGDATPSVATGNIFKHHASTQTINMFDGGVCGQIITVISTAAITYDFNASNLKCGSADVVTASGDVTMWVFDGTNWYLLSWMDVSANLADGSAGGF
jgi:hypothetical protein